MRPCSNRLQNGIRTTGSISIRIGPDDDLGPLDAAAAIGGAADRGGGGIRAGAERRAFTALVAGGAPNRGSVHRNARIALAGRANRVVRDDGLEWDDAE